MADNVKVLIGEKNGVELAFQEEYALTPSNIPFTSPDFDGVDLHEVLVELESQFAHWNIVNNYEQYIKENKQMRVDGEICIDGYLEIEGQLIIEE